SDVGMSLARVSDRPQLPYSFVVIDNSTPNAWALPGGKIAINRGLLVELKNEAELAAVLSHEIVHAAARHSAKALERSTLLGAGLAGINTYISNQRYSSVVMGSLSTGFTLITYQYSRNNELEADEYSMKYMVRAGYDAQAAGTLQEKFVQLSEGKNQQWLGGLFATHPPSRQRVEALKGHIKKYPPTGDLGVKEFEKVMRPLNNSEDTYDDIDEGFSSVKGGDIAKGFASGRQAVKTMPKEPMAHALLGDAEYARGNNEKAIISYDKAIELNDHHFYYYLKRGIVKYETEDYDGAHEDLSKSMELLPTSEAYDILGRIYFLRDNNDK
ncbi:MAG: M48 family metalloprotease, partial [Waddliaceae bacterium]|nr:M48 family metalloprotease [Waddliaceae bacterium]